MDCSRAAEAARGCDGATNRIAVVGTDALNVTGAEGGTVAAVVTGRVAKGEIVPKEGCGGCSGPVEGCNVGGGSEYSGGGEGDKGMGSRASDGIDLMSVMRARL